MTSSNGLALAQTEKGNEEQSTFIPRHSINYLETKAVANQLSAEGFPNIVGTILRHEDCLIDVYVYGGDLLGLNDFQIKHPSVRLRMHRAVFSREELEAADRRILDSYSGEQSPDGLILASTYILPDGSGISIELDSTSPLPEAGWLLNLQSEVKVKLFLEEDRSFLRPASSRAQDEFPWSGGAFFLTYPDSGYPNVCSTGFGVKSTTTAIKYMLTARHCFTNETGEPIESYQMQNWIGNWNPSPYYNFESNDLSLIRLSVSSLSGATYYGPFNSTSKRNVIGLESNNVGDSFCTNGGNSGLHCGVQITKGPVTRLVEGRQVANVYIGRRPDNGIIAAFGDSGGPVITSGNSTTGVYGVGILALASPNALCSDVNTPTNKGNSYCGREVGFTDLGKDLLASHMDLE